MPLFHLLSPFTFLLCVTSLSADIIALIPIPAKGEQKARWQFEGDVDPATIELAGITDHSVISKGFTSNGFAWFTADKIIENYHESFSFGTKKLLQLKKVAFPYNVFSDAAKLEKNPEQSGINVKLLINGVNLGSCQWRVGNPEFAAWTWDASRVPPSKNYCVEFIFNETGKGITTFEVAFANRPNFGVDRKGICLEAVALPDPVPSQ